MLDAVTQKMIDSLSAQEAQKLHKSVSQLIYKARKSRDEKKIEAIQQKLADSMADEWQKEATRAVNKISKIFDKKSGTAKKSDIAKAQKIAKSHLSGFGTMFKRDIEKAIEEVYKIGKNKFFKDSVQPIQKAAEFGIKDKKTVAQLANQYKIAVDSYYEENLSEVLANLIEQEMFDEAGAGLAYEAASETIISRLKENLGLDEQDLSGLKPPGFAGSARQYFENEIQTTVTRARAMGNVQALREAEVEKYIVVNPDPISEICQQMNGRVFEVEAAVKTMDKILEADSPEELKEITPWSKDLSDFGITGEDQKLENSKFNNKLALAGFALPPYHSNCKSEIEIFTG